jgi:hypothetical protein
MNRLKLVSFNSIFSVLLVISQSGMPTHAVYGGDLASGDERVVLVVPDKLTNRACSGSLASSRIVFTAGHCVGTAGFVYPPNSTIGIYRPEPVAVIKHFLPNDFNECNDCGRGPINDFAILILEKPLENVTPLRVASLREIENVIKNQIDVIQVGYGAKDLSPNNKPKPGIANFPERINSKLRFEPLAQGNREEQELIKLKPNIFVNAMNSPNMTMCGGDSGSPLYYKDLNEYVYIGALSTVTGIECRYSATDPFRSNPYWIDRTFAVYYSATYFSDLISEAEKYVADNPYVEPKATNTGLNKKITITCINGKSTKKVRVVTPKCPRGYKQITLDKAKPVAFAPCAELGLLKNGFSCVLVDEQLSWLKMTLSKPQDGRPTVGSSCYRNKVVALGYGSRGELIPMLCTTREFNREEKLPVWSADTTPNPGE